MTVAIANPPVREQMQQRVRLARERRRRKMRRAYEFLRERNEEKPDGREAE